MLLECDKIEVLRLPLFNYPVPVLHFPLVLGVLDGISELLAKCTKDAA